MIACLSRLDQLGASQHVGMPLSIPSDHRWVCFSIMHLLCWPLNEAWILCVCVRVCDGVPERPPLAFSMQCAVGVYDIEVASGRQTFDQKTSGRKLQHARSPLPPGCMTYLVQNTSVTRLICLLHLTFPPSDKGIPSHSTIFSLHIHRSNRTNYRRYIRVHHWLDPTDSLQPYHCLYRPTTW